MSGFCIEVGSLLDDEMEQSVGVEVEVQAVLHGLGFMTRSLQSTTTAGSDADISTTSSCCARTEPSWDQAVHASQSLGPDPSVACSLNVRI